MATGGEKPESSAPATTSGASAAGDDNHDHHKGNDKHDQNKEKTAPSSSSSSSESSWGEPVESTASANHTKSSPAAVVSPTIQLRSASAGALDADDRSPTAGQPMDRMEDPDAYRIPSEVFSRTKSSTPMEWSVASNESLFSIQMGNMSFTKDHAFLFGKSDELGYDPAMSMGLSPMASPMRDRPPLSSPPKSSNSSSPKPAETTPSNHQGLVIAPVEDDKKAGGGGGSGSSFGESTRAAQTMHEATKQSESGGGGNQNNLEAGSAPMGTGGGSGPLTTQVIKDPSFHSASLRRSSTASGASVKSFAFPILTGDGQHRSTQSQSQPPTPQAAQDPVTPRTSDRDNSNNNNSKPSTPKSGENKGNQQGGGTSGGGQGSKWFSCFPCCPSRTS